MKKFLIVPLLALVALSCKKREEKKAEPEPRFVAAIKPEPKTAEIVVEEPVKPLTPGELFLKENPENQDDAMLMVKREIAKAGLKESLWTDDFDGLSRVIGKTVTLKCDSIFLELFGTPDSEKTEVTQNEFLPSQFHQFRYLIYFDRALNPTTKKREHLFFEFVDGRLTRMLVPSGNEWGIRYR